MSLPPIKFLITLMLENRSFDHMLGFLDLPGIDGLRGGRSNDDDTGEPVRATNDARFSGDFEPDPGHDFANVQRQLYGVPNPTPGQEPDMSGFVKDYAIRCNGDIVASRRIMRCFDPTRIPALTTLAKNFAVCNRWFSSIPGPTLPNRLFAHAGTSGGRLDLSPEALGGFKTIYELLNRENIDATVYAESWTGLATIPGLLKEQGQFFARLDDSPTGFFTACKRGKLARYSFIEPRYSSRMDGGIILPQNDQHPDSDVREGDNLIRRIYQAIRKSDKIWKNCLFVNTYDEHGGTYDHVVPPKAIPPDEGSDLGFSFDRYGVRVPAVLVSPYIKAGRMLNEVFDHTSLLATAAELFLGRRLAENELGKRAAVAKSLSSCFDAGLVANGPRTDRVTIPAAADPPKPSPIPRAKWSELLKEHLRYAEFLESTLPPAAQTDIDTDTLQMDVNVTDYVERVLEAAKANAEKI